jgi:drug/metabolite transporter (DMT)-like permease
MISASTMILPLALAFEHPWTLTPSAPAIGATVILGVFPTALAMVMLIALVDRAGATFLSLSNYLVPVVGILLGAIWLGEKIVWQTGIAFLLICLGIYITGRKVRPKSGTPARTA